MSVSARVRALIEPLVAAEGLELFDLEQAGPVLRVTVDRQGGVSIDDITKTTRAISRAIDEHDPISSSFTLEVSSPGLERGILERFVGAMSASNHTALLELLDSDVELISDGGGKVSAARRPLYGSREVSRFLIELGKRHAGRLGGRMVKVNNDWGGIVTINDEIDSVFSIRISDGRISGVYIVRNPDKLALVAKPTSV